MSNLLSQVDIDFITSAPDQSKGIATRKNVGAAASGVGFMEEVGDERGRTKHGENQTM